MLDIKLIRQDPESVRVALRHRGDDPGKVDRLLELDAEFRALQARIDVMRQERNHKSKTIGAIRTGRGEGDAETLQAEVRALGETLASMEAELAENQKARLDPTEGLLYQIPNVPDPSVPVGASEEDNLEVRRWGEPVSFPWPAQPHEDIGERLGLLSTEVATRLAGSRFVLLRAQGARLERALLNLMLDLHVANGYTEVLPPTLANTETLTANGNLPKFKDQLFQITDWPFYLIPTAEVPLTNMHRGEILEAAQLPMNLTAGTSCFRSEAGAAGRDTKGMIRVHEFRKVELVKLVAPEDGVAALEGMVADAERVLQTLELPYRVVQLCTGDLGFNSAITYDLEVWFPSQGKYREISSCSLCTDFQTRRGQTRYRDGDQLRHPYSLNGSGVAVGRCLAAVLENGLQEDGTVRLPAALVPYMGGHAVLGAGV